MKTTENTIITSPAGLSAKQYGYALRQARNAEGLTQMQLGTLTGIKYQRIAGYEIGRRMPDESTKAILNKAVHVSLYLSDQTLLTGQDPHSYQSEIRKARVRKGITQTDAGSSLGIMQNRYALFEEELEPMPKTLGIKLAELLGVKLEDLLPEGMNTWEEYQADIRSRNQKAGAAVRQLREAKGISREEFAEMLGVNLSYLLIIENGARGISKKSLRKMSRILGCSMGDIIGVARENYVSLIA